MPESIPIISHTSVPALSLPSEEDHTPTPTTSTSTTTGTSSLQVKRSRPRLLKRLSAQSLLTRSKHSNGSNVSLVDSSSSTTTKEEKENKSKKQQKSETVSELVDTATAKAPNQPVITTTKTAPTSGVGSTSLPTRKPSFSLSTPSITIATYQKEVVTSTATDLSSSTSTSTQQQ
ncbi:hypothetical protein BDA99DRAFT_558127 [Phascolomyces articulosus]|uniref:Uncharacterized protein n=1 Tax=Phascolomyces articulosus TaxID=60185 RepID=A0AAD5KD77_9FUNG|nr:hypothetical protein BDA99DRAFT_558127 [Phascolomyces articulosus]